MDMATHLYIHNGQDANANKGVGTSFSRRFPGLFHKSLSFEEMEVEAMEIDSGNTMK